MEIELSLQTKYNELRIHRHYYHNSELCSRPEESQLDLKSNRAQVVISVRRCGKSTLCDVFYYKEASFQIDFVIAKDGNVQELIQVSYYISTEKTRNREIRVLKNAAKKLKCNNLTLITFEEHETIQEDGYTINVIPATEWLLNK